MPGRTVATNKTWLVLRKKKKKTLARDKACELRDVSLTYLGTVGVAGRVQANVLDAEQVVAGREALGELDRDLGGAHVGPGRASGAEGGLVLEDLEPHGAVTIEGLGGGTVGGLGHVKGLLFGATQSVFTPR